MVALIDKIGEPKADPDKGETYGRFLTSPQNAIKLLNWGEPGRIMFEEAIEVAKTKLGLKVFLDKDEFINKALLHKELLGE